MDIAEFQRTLTVDGYPTAVEVEIPANTVNENHSHEWDVRALVLSGAITLLVNNSAVSYSVGEIFAVEAGCEHHETVSDVGVTFLVGRRERSIG